MRYGDNGMPARKHDDPDFDESSVPEQTGITTVAAGSNAPVLSSVDTVAANPNVGSHDDREPVDTFMVEPLDTKLADDLEKRASRNKLADSTNAGVVEQKPQNLSFSARRSKSASVSGPSASGRARSRVGDLASIAAAAAAAHANRTARTDSIVSIASSAPPDNSDDELDGSFVSRPARRTIDVALESVKSLGDTESQVSNALPRLLETYQSISYEAQPQEFRQAAITFILALLKLNALYADTFFSFIAEGVSCIGKTFLEVYGNDIFEAGLREFYGEKYTAQDIAHDLRLTLSKIRTPDQLKKFLTQERWLNHNHAEKGEMCGDVLVLAFERYLLRCHDASFYQMLQTELCSYQELLKPLEPLLHEDFMTALSSKNSGNDALYQLLQKNREDFDQCALIIAAELFPEFVGVIQSERVVPYLQKFNAIFYSGNGLERWRTLQLPRRNASPVAHRFQETHKVQVNPEEEAKAFKRIFEFSVPSPNRLQLQNAPVVIGFTIVCQVLDEQGATQKIDLFFDDKKHAYDMSTLPVLVELKLPINNSGINKMLEILSDPEKYDLPEDFFAEKFLELVSGFVAKSYREHDTMSVFSEAQSAHNAEPAAASSGNTSAPAAPDTTTMPG